MTDWSNPSVTQSHSNELDSTKGRDESNARMDYSTDSNIPDRTVRFNRTQGRFEEYDTSAGTWGELRAKYSINVDQLDGRNAGNAAGNIPINNGSLNNDLNADQVDGQDATTFMYRANNGSDIQDASAFKGNIGVGSMAERDVFISQNEPDNTQGNDGDVWFQYRT